jgi:Family of unknown function (DUF6229)
MAAAMVRRSDQTPSEGCDHMSAIVEERTAEEVVARWRAGESVDGLENPAGPLFTGGRYAEYEVTMNGPCSAGTASCIFMTGLTVFCC